VALMTRRWAHRRSNIAFGWFAPIAFRLAFYLFWHMIYGGLGPF
jgi:hypothetical protein